MSRSVEIGLRLRAARKAAHFKTASAFAETFHIPISTYSQHENGKRMLNADVLLQYSEYLDVSAGWLLTGEGQPFSDCKNIVEKMEVLARELFSLDKTLYTLSPVAPIEGGLAWVDIELLQHVIAHFVPLFKESQLAISEKELVAFIIEVYNGVVMTSASREDKQAMIDLSIASLKRGAIKESASTVELKESASA